MDDKISRFNYMMIDEIREKINSRYYITILAKIYLLGYVKQLNTIKELNKEQPHDNIKEYLELLFNQITITFSPLKQALSELKEEQNLDESTLSKITKSILDVPFDKKDWRDAIENLFDIGDKKLSEFLMTPKCVNKLGIDLLSPINGNFYDGVAGTNGTLISTHEYVKERDNQISLFSQEINPHVAALGTIRTFINGITDITVQVGDTIADPKFIEGNSLKKFDYIMMNFPFGMSWKYKKDNLLYDKYSRFHYGIPNKSSSEWLFISHTIKSLKENGKAVVMASSSSLFNTGTEKIRSNIIQEDIIESVISLPSGILSYTSIPVHMIVLNKNKVSKGKILFINTEAMHTHISRTLRIIDNRSIAKIVEIYKENKEIEEISRLVGIQDLYKSMLIPNKYVGKTEIETENFGKIKIKPNEIKKISNLKRLGSLGKFYRGISTSSCVENQESGEYKIINLADVQDGELKLGTVTRYDIKNNAKIDNYTVELGDIIVSSKGSITKICIIPKHNGKMLISQNFIGIRLREDQSPEFIKEYLESPIGKYLIKDKQLGSTIKMLNSKELQEVEVIYLSDEKQKKILFEYEQKKESIKTAIQNLEQELKELQLDLYSQMGIEKTFTLLENLKDGIN